MSSNEFGKYLKLLRKVKKMTCLAVSDKVGVTRGYITSIENGAFAAPPPSVIRKISIALGCTHVDLMIKAGHITEQEVFEYFHDARREEIK